MITADQILCHLVGDYLLQSDWQALEKVKKSTACLIHAIFYTLPFLFLTHSWKSLLIIAGTHFIIDRWRLARYVCWVKNYLAPKWIPGPFPNEPQRLRNYPWSECSVTGYHKDRPVWLAVWLLIIADNTMHLICNGLALRFMHG